LSPSLPRAPKLPQVPRLDESLPELPALLQIGQEAQEQAPTFQDRLAQWGRGSRAAFVVWSFLTSKNMQEGVDFQFDGDQFMIGSGLLWRIRSGQATDRAKASIDKMLYERRGVRVEDFDPTALVPGRSEPMLGASLERTR